MLMPVLHLLMPALHLLMPLTDSHFWMPLGARSMPVHTMRNHIPSEMNRIHRPSHYVFALHAQVFSQMPPDDDGGFTLNPIAKVWDGTDTFDCSS